MARAAFFYWLLLSASLPLAAAEHDLDEAKAAFRAGNHKEVIQRAEAAVKARERGEDWPLLLAEALWTIGQYEEAAKAIQRAQSLYYYSIRVRLAAHRIYRSAGDLESARDALDQINALGGSRRWGPREPVDLVALGQAAVIMGADPKLVLDKFYNPVKEAEPELREVYLAIGNLALEKHDYALAGRAFQEGLAKHPEDPDLLYGLAEALAPSDRGEMIDVLEKIKNKQHLGARLLMAEHLIDAEEYAEAERELSAVESVNPNRPEMWAFRAVIAHLRNQPDVEKEARGAGLKFWKTNPFSSY